MCSRASRRTTRWARTPCCPVGLALMGPLVHVMGVSWALVVGALGVLVPSLAVLGVADVRRPVGDLAPDVLVDVQIA